MLNKPLDRITEAYNGVMGEDFSKKTRARINWVVNQVKGKQVLDIGCSQGIVPIILGREGKEVDALDINSESINYAKEQLKEEHESVQANINFKISNFMTENELKQKYETILLTEVLEHISDPCLFLEKINNHLDTGGKFIVTVPFGINDYFDHKRTYYLLDLYEQLSASFSVENVEFLGKWTGVVCRKKENDTKNSKEYNILTKVSLKKLESAFYSVERELLNKVEQFQRNTQEKNEYIKRLQNQHTRIVEQLKEQINQHQTHSTEITEKLLNITNLQQEDKLEFKDHKQKNYNTLQKIVEQNIELKTQISTMNNHSELFYELFTKTLTEKEKEINSLQQKVTELQNKEDRLLENIKFKNNNIETLEKEINSLQQKVTELQNKEDRLLEDIKFKNNNLETLEKDINFYKTKLESKELEVEELQNVSKSLTKELERARFEIAEVKSKLDTIEDPDNTNGNCIELKDELAKVKEMNINLQSELKKMNEIKVDLEGNIKIQNANIQRDLNEKEKLVKENIDYNQSFNNLKEEYLASLNNEEKALKLLLLEAEKSEYKDERINELEGKLDKMERRYHALKSSKLGGITLKYWQVRKKYLKNN